MPLAPVVNIIIPAYNAERFLAQTIASVQAQTRPDWELIVIDDGSKDNTVALVGNFAAQDARIRVVPYENGGVVVARNRGFAETRPDVPYVAYLDHDDLWEPDFLETLVTALEANPRAVGAHGVARYIDNQGQPCEFQGGEVWPRERFSVIKGCVVPVGPDTPTSFAVEVVLNCLATPGQMLMRRDILAQLEGPFHVDCNPCDDLDLYFRMTQHGDILFLNRVVIGWRQHGSNVSKDSKRMDRMKDYVQRKLLNSPTLSLAHRRIAWIGYSYGQRRVAAIWLKSARTCLTERKFARAANHTRFALQSYVRSLRGRPTDAA